MDDHVRPGSAPTVGQQIAEALRRDIVRGTLTHGEHLPPETALLEEFGVSRPVLREALRILQSESLLEIHRGRRGGARVNAPTPEAVALQAGRLLQHRGATLADVFDARRLIEPPAAALLAGRRDPLTIEALETALRAEQQATEGTAHAEFHLLVVELSGSRTLALFARMIADITRAHTAAVLGSAAVEDRHSGAHQAHAAHDRLVELVRAGDGPAAQAQWAAHLAETSEPMLRGQRGRRVLEVMMPAESR